MPNMRLIYSNEIDSATITASTTAGSLVASNMQNEYKGKVHRSTGTSVTYTCTWGTTKTVGGVALPATNLTGSATIRVRLYDQTGTRLLSDSGTVYACPGNNIELWNWNMPLNANAFIFGGASKSVVWFDSHYAVDKIIIDLVDTTNPAGYIDCSRIVAGIYWEPTYNVSNGLNVTLADMSENSRNASGDLLSNRGAIYDTLEFDFDVLVEQDKIKLLQILRKIGTSNNILISIFPDSNSLIEQQHLIYGKRSNSSVSTKLYGIYSHAMQIEGW